MTKKVLHSEGSRQHSSSRIRSHELILPERISSLDHLAHARLNPPDGDRCRRDAREDVEEEDYQGDISQLQSVHRSSQGTRGQTELGEKTNQNFESGINLRQHAEQVCEPHGE